MVTIMFLAVFVMMLRSPSELPTKPGYRTLCDYNGDFVGFIPWDYKFTSFEQTIEDSIDG